MAMPVDPQTGLVRFFAEFDLLPELLACVQESVEAVPPESWSLLLEKKGFSMDHFMEVELLKRSDLASIMAEDAWRLAKWLELFDADGLTSKGYSIAMLADTAPDERNSSMDWSFAEALRIQIRKCYLGAEGLSLADLVQAGTKTLEESQDVWIKHCRGLFLVEFEALLYTGSTDKKMAETLVEELVQHRRNAMRTSPHAMRGVEEIENKLRHMFAVSRYYRDELSQYMNSKGLKSDCCAINRKTV